MRLSETLKSLRLSSESSQSAIAKAAGISTTQYQNYEYGKSEPTAPVLAALSDYFGVTIDYLVGKSDLPDYSSSEDIEPFPQFPHRLKALREEKSIDLFSMAYQVGETPRNYAGYEEGEVMPRLRLICTLADYFDVSLDYLVGRSDDPTRR